MIISIISLCIAAITLLYGYCRDKKQDNQSKFLLNKIDFVAGISVQTDREIYYDERQKELKRMKPDELTNGYNKTEKYLEDFFDLLQIEYHAFKQGSISETFWQQKLDNNKQLVKDAPLVYQPFWKKRGGNYDQEFASFIHHEVFA